MRLLSDMKTENKLLTWAIIRKDDAGPEEQAAGASHWARRSEA
jgi:hypothetical protein